MDNKKLKFKRLAKEIYGTCPGNTNDKQKQLFQMQLINTVDKNKTFFTKRQQVEAKRARELLNSVRFQSVEDIKVAIRMNLIRNNLVTNKYVHWIQRFMVQILAN